MDRIGIILAGGTGSRLWPVTCSVNKHLLPVYDKPMIFYPIYTLMSSGVREIVIIHNPNDEQSFVDLIGNGERFGVQISFLVQHNPIGIPDALAIAKHKIGNKNIVLALGDNLFFGHELGNLLKQANKSEGNTVFLAKVKNPESFGVMVLSETGEIKALIEKPTDYISDLAITGLYFLENGSVELQTELKFSNRNELEITDLLKILNEKNRLSYKCLGDGDFWLDGGTSEALLDAGLFIKTRQEREDFLICSPEQLALEGGWISKESVKSTLSVAGESAYALSLRRVLAKHLHPE